MANLAHFQQLMFRPLYWFSSPAGPDRARSLAYPPVYSVDDRTVTITLKPGRWSDGTSIVNTNVMFWLNLLHAEPANWGGYQPGGDAIPDDLASVTEHSTNQVTLTLTHRVNPTWFTDNQLSQLTPLPLSWDRTSSARAPGSGGCAHGLYATVDNQCANVYRYLAQQAGYSPTRPTATNRLLSSYATNPLWQTVDGPWHLVAFSASGTATFAPNASYSGGRRPTLARFTEQAFGSGSAEYAALSAGSLGVGYLPASQPPGATAHPLQPGSNPVSGYTLAPHYAASIAYTAYNFHSNGDGGAAGAILSQVYVRQALQELVDQPQVISTVLRGYGLPGYGPLPVTASPAPSQANPFPPNPKAAAALLGAHGWHVAAGGTSTCAAPGTGTGQCGAGIPAGARLAFTFAYPANTPLVAALVSALSSQWSQAGVSVTPSAVSPSSLAAATAPCPQGCPWELATSGAGWLFSPDHYPSGESLFSTGAVGNAGGYSDPTADSLIDATTTAPPSAAPGALAAYQRYLARQLPVGFAPAPATSLTEVRQGLSGVVPQNPYTQLTPEDWRSS